MNGINDLPLEVQQELGKQAVKAVDKLSNGLGKVLGYFFEAKHMKQMAEAEAYKIKALADAKSYEINTIGEAIRNNQDLPMTFNNGDTSLSIDTTNTEQLLQRANYRLQYQQARKEHNIESVIGKTVLELENKTVESTDDVDEDWLNRFFNIVEDVSDEQLQSLWSRILAGEILKPKSYSLRLLEILRNISESELAIIMSICSYVTGDFIFSSEVDEEYKFFSYSDILLLEELGILNSDSLLSYTVMLNPNEQKHLLFQIKDMVCLLNNRTVEQKEISFGIYKMTTVGKKLCELANEPCNLDFIKYNLEKIGENQNGINIGIYKIIEKSGDKIRFSQDPIYIVSK